MLEVTFKHFMKIDNHIAVSPNFDRLKSLSDKLYNLGSDIEEGK
jgi:hypothetical protein